MNVLINVLFMPLAPAVQTCQQMNPAEEVAVKGSSERAAELGEVDLHEQPIAPSEIRTKEAQPRPDSGSHKQSQDYGHNQDSDSKAVYQDQAQPPQEIPSRVHFPPTPLPVTPNTTLEFGQDRPNTGSSYSGISMLPVVSTPSKIKGMTVVSRSL